MSRRSSSSNNLSRHDSLASSPIALTPNPHLSSLPPPINTSASRRKFSGINLDVDAVASNMLGSRRQSTISNLIITSSSRKQSSVSYSSDILGQYGIPSIIKKESSVESIQDGAQKDIKQSTKITFKEGQKGKKREILKLENPAALKRKNRKKRKSRSKSKSVSPTAARKTKPFLVEKPVEKVETKKKTAKDEISLTVKSKLEKEHEEAVKKLKDLTLINEKLKKSEMDLTKANEEIKSDENLKTLEVEKLIQFWTITRQKLVEEEERATELEGKLQRMKTAHIEQVSEWTAQKAHDAIRSNDEQLAELISEIENARLQAQTDFKFAVVQMEQKLRQEHEIELRTIKEEKERQLEDINRVQNDKLLLAEQEKAQLRADLSNEITEQKLELLQLRDRLAEKEAQNQSMATDLAMQEKSVKYLSSENEVLTRECKQLKQDLKNDKSNLKMLVLLKRRLEKIEEINEILLAEFKKIELEKNYLLEQVNQLTASKLIGHQTKRLQPSFKASQFGQELDEIRQNFGGLHIT